MTGTGRRRGHVHPLIPSKGVQMQLGHKHDCSLMGLSRQTRTLTCRMSSIGTADKMKTRQVSELVGTEVS